MRVLIAMETSGQTRRAFEVLGHDVVSCDLLPAEDGARNHVVGDVFDLLDREVFDLMVAHPTCTYLTCSAEWAYKENPGKKMKPGTLFGAARKEARERAVLDFLRLANHKNAKKKALENPVGVMSSRWRKPDQIIQPWQFGDDASKATCLWLEGLRPLKIEPSLYVAPRLVCRDCGATYAYGWEQGCNCGGPLLPRWANQTDSGQNREPPAADRWKIRSKTYAGIAAAFAANWGV